MYIEDINNLQGNMRNALSSLYDFLAKYHSSIDYKILNLMVDYIKEANEIDKTLNDWRF